MKLSIEPAFYEFVNETYTNSLKDTFSDIIWIFFLFQLNLELAEYLVSISILLQTILTWNHSQIKINSKLIDVPLTGFRLCLGELLPSVRCSIKFWKIFNLDRISKTMRTFSLRTSIYPSRAQTFCFKFHNLFGYLIKIVNEKKTNRLYPCKLVALSC